MTASLEGLITDALVEKAAIALWLDEAERIGTRHIPERQIFTEQLPDTQAKWRGHARAALLSVLPDIRRAVLEEAAKACEQYVHHQHPTKPIGVIISSSPHSLAHANAIRALAKEGT